MVGLLERGERGAWRASTRSSEACRRGERAARLPPAPLARRPVRGSSGAPRRAAEEGALVVERRRLERRCVRAPGWLDRAGGRVGERAERGGARFQRGLAAQHLLELLLVLLLVEQLPAGEAIDPARAARRCGPRSRTASRPRGDQPRQHVVAEGEIGRRGDAPHRHDDQRADHDPEGDRAEPHLPAGMDEGVVRALALRRRGRRGLAPAWRGTMADGSGVQIDR